MRKPGSARSRPRSLVSVVSPPDESMARNDFSRHRPRTRTTQWTMSHVSGASTSSVGESGWPAFAGHDNARRRSLATSLVAAVLVMAAGIAAAQSPDLRPYDVVGDAIPVP